MSYDWEKNLCMVCRSIHYSSSFVDHDFVPRPEPQKWYRSEWVDENEVQTSWWLQAWSEVDAEKRALAINQEWKGDWIAADTWYSQQPEVQKLKLELEDWRLLESVLTPLAHWFKGDYNKWKAANKQVRGYNEAKEFFQLWPGHLTRWLRS